MLKLIHIDLGGYYVPSLDGHQYFLIVVDDYSRYIWLYFLATKDMQSTSAALKQFKAYAENQFECKIKWSRTNNGTGEFKNKK